MHEQYKNKFSQNMVVSAASAVVGCAITMVSYPVYLHFLGYSDYGLWMIVSTFITLCQIGSLGIAPALSKLVAEEIGKNNRECAQLYVGIAISVVAILGLIVLTILVLCRNPIWVRLALKPETAHTLSRLLPYILILSFYAFLNDVFTAVLVGLGRTDAASIIQTSGQAVAFCCSFVFLSLGLGVISLAYGTLASLLLIHVLASRSARYLGPLKLRPGFRLEWAKTKNLLRLTATVFATSLTAACFVPLNKFLLSRYVGLAAVPVYEVAFGSSMRLRAIFEMPLRPIMPSLSHARAFGEFELYLALANVRRQSRRLLLIASFSFGFLFLFANPILHVWLRRALDPSLPSALRIALVGAFVSLLGVPSYHSLLGLGRAGELLRSQLVQSVTNIGIVLTGIYLGYSLSSGTLLFASSAAMCASTCYLLARHISTVKSITHAPKERAVSMCEVESVVSK